MLINLTSVGFCPIFSTIFQVFYINCKSSDIFAKVFDRSFDRVWYAGFLHKLKSYWIWVFMDGKFFQECPVNSVFAKVPFLVLHFSYYTIMPNLLVLSVIFLSMLMILSTLNVIRHLICGNNYSWPPNLNLIY